MLEQTPDYYMVKVMQAELHSVHLNATFFTHASDSEDKILLSNHIKNTTDYC